MLSSSEVYAEEATKLMLLGHHEDAATNLTHAMQARGGGLSVAGGRGVLARCLVSANSRRWQMLVQAEWLGEDMIALNGFREPGLVC